MADIQHESIPDSLRHEPKGASTATNGQVLTSNGDGTTTFKEVPETSLSVTDTLIALSYTDQMLTNTGTELQISFGDAKNSTSGALSLNTDGSLTVNEQGVYEVSVFVSTGRTTSAGQTELAFSFRLNGTQVGSTQSLSIDSDSDTFAVPMTVTNTYELNVGDVVTYHMARLSNGAAEAGLKSSGVAIIGWGDIPSARLGIRRVEVV